jgi:hypothetical protein
MPPPLVTFTSHLQPALLPSLPLPLLLLLQSLPLPVTVAAAVVSSVALLD